MVGSVSLCSCITHSMLSWSGCLGKLCLCLTRGKAIFHLHRAKGSPLGHQLLVGVTICLLILMCFLLQAQKAENIMEHEAEIYARPARTWFQTEHQKRQAAKGAREAATSAPDIQAAVKGVAARKGAQGGAAATGKKGKLTKQEQQALRVKKNTFMEVGFSFCHEVLLQGCTLGQGEEASVAQDFHRWRGAPFSC